MVKPLLILGGGGHASVLVDILEKQGREILGVVSPVVESAHLTNYRHYPKDEDVLLFTPSDVMLVNGIGSMPKESLRQRINSKFTETGYEFETVISSSAIVSEKAILGKGVQVLQGAIIQVGVVIGENTIINTGAQVDHDCTIGFNNHLAPGVVLSGNVKTGNEVHFGTNSTVIQSLLIGNNSIIGAGSTITQNVPDNTICYPAKNTFKEITVNES